MSDINPTIPPTAWIAPTATVRGNVTLGEEVSVWFSAVIRGDEDEVRVGDGSNIQDGAVLHVSSGFPCIIGKQVTVGHGAIVHGCTVEDGALIGMRATVLDGAVIGAGAMVGAGAVVPPGMIVPPNTLVLGIPAKIMGELNDRQRAMTIIAAQHYIERKEEYRNGKY
jgi:carbonic anhydrase/acetyltransferase-like protein (isoleucine patch superfamily)